MSNDEQQECWNKKMMLQCPKRAKVALQLRSGPSAKMPEAENAKA